MKTFVIFLLLMGAVFRSSYAQNLIAVQNGGTSMFYQQVDSAIIHAQNGDTIYIPGGTYEDIIINKKLHLVGVGHHPDSTSVTNMSQMSGSFHLITGADGGSVTGLKICNLVFGTSIENQSINNYIITRCWIGGLSLGQSSPGMSNNISIIENIIGTINGFYTTNNIFLNNIIGRAYNLNNSTFKNNIFLGIYSSCSGSGSGSGISNITNSEFENNFIKSFDNVTYSIFNNNIGSSTASFVTGTNVGLNNFINISTSSTFVSSSTSFSYSDDYHLKSTSIGVNAGRDGTHIGIYGGAFPWKEGSIPFNPHFQRINISPTTDNNGNLNVNIKVAAQER